MRERLIDLVRAHEPACAIRYPVYLALGPLTLFVHTVVEATRLLQRHEGATFESFDFGWLRASGSRSDTADSFAEPDEAALLALRLWGRATGFGPELATARTVAVGALGLALIVAATPWLLGATLMLAAAIAGYVVATTALTFTFAFHLRLRRHELAVAYLRLLAEAPPIDQARAELEEIDRRWHDTFQLDAIYAATALTPCFAGLPLLLLPAVLLAPLGRHLRLATCGVTAPDGAG